MDEYSPGSIDDTSLPRSILADIIILEAITNQASDRLIDVDWQKAQDLVFTNFLKLTQGGGLGRSTLVDLATYCPRTLRHSR